MIVTDNDKCPNRPIGPIVPILPITARVLKIIPVLWGGAVAWRERVWRGGVRFFMGALRLIDIVRPLRP